MNMQVGVHDKLPNFVPDACLFFIQLILVLLPLHIAEVTSVHFLF